MKQGDVGMVRATVSRGVERAASREDGACRGIGARCRGNRGRIGCGGGRVHDDAYRGPEDLARQIEDLDILVDVGGAFRAKPFVKITDADWTSVLDENVVRSARTARRALSAMLLQDCGVVVFLMDPRGAGASWDRIHQEVTYHARLSLVRELEELVRGANVIVAPLASEMLAKPVDGDQLRSARTGERSRGDEFAAMVADLVRSHPTQS